MANWKKVIVSGSNAHLNHITASGNISASGFLFGNLPSSDLDQVVIYNSGSGRLEFKTLNLISTERASRLALFERNDNDINNTHFKLSYDTGSAISGIAPVILVSSSDDGGSSYNNSTLAYKGINDEYSDIRPNADDEVFFNPPTNTTGSIGDVREGVYSGQTSILPVSINFQSVDNTNDGFPAYFNGSNLNFGARAFDRGGIGELRIYINTMDANNPTETIDLTPGAAITTDNSNLTMALFATASNLGAGDAPDPTKHYRSGSMTIKAAGGAQTDGFNYAFALHTGSDNGTQFSYITNVFQWFYDTQGAGLEMDFENQGIISNPTYDVNATHSISGIRFFDETAADNTSFKYGIKAINQYRNIYPTAGGIQVDGVTTATVDRIEITQSGQYIDTSDSNVKQLDTSINTNNNTFNLVDLIANNANAHTNDTEITASFGITFDNLTGDFVQPTPFLDGFTTDNIENSSNGIGFTFQLNSVSGHKNTTSSDAVTLGDYMVNTLTSASNVYDFETFRGEDYRIQSKSYTTTSTIPGSDGWDSTKNVVNGGAGFNQNAIQYYSHLLYPTGAGAGGTFNPTFGPTALQPSNYNDTDANGTREYFRYFTVNSDANGAKQVNIELIGDGKVVTENSTIFTAGTNALKIEAWRNGSLNNTNYSGQFVNVLKSDLNNGGIRFGGTVANDKWIPLATDSDDIDYAENAHDNGGGNTTPKGVIKISDSNNETFQSGDQIILRFMVPENWSGNIDAIALTFGGGITTSTRALGITYADSTL